MSDFIKFGHLPIAGSDRRITGFWGCVSGYERAPSTLDQQHDRKVFAIGISRIVPEGLGARAQKEAIGPEVCSMRITALLKQEAGQAIAAFAVLLPVFVFVAFAIVDIQGMTKQAANIDYVVNEVARCEALHESTPSAPLPCNPATGGVSPHDYALQLAANLRLGTGAGFAISTPDCRSDPNDPVRGLCDVDIQYGYKPLGVWFPAATITRRATASYMLTP
jgi:hypothetical protein